VKDFFKYGGKRGREKEREHYVDSWCVVEGWFKIDVKV
jgi:hypothetical protein